LAGRYGHAATEVLRIAADRPELAGPIVPGQPDLLAEVVQAARREQARSVGDVLLRRTRLGILAARGLADGPAAGVAAVLGAELGWDEARTAAEADRFGEEAQAEGIVVAPPPAGTSVPGDPAGGPASTPGAPNL
jgi:glycerol-3-phosphate dehydrogenase